MNSLTIQLLALLIVIGIVAAWLFRSGRKADSERRARLSDREDLSFVEFERRFYDGAELDSNQLRGALGDIASALDIPVGKLRPTDRFDAELAPPKGWEIDDGAALLVRLLEKRGGKLPSGDAKLQTLDEYLRSASVRRP